MSEAFLNKVLDDVVRTIDTDIRNELNYLETSARFTPATLEAAVYEQLTFTSVTEEKNEAGERTGKFVPSGTVKYPVWDRLTESQKITIQQSISEKAEDINGRLKKEFESIATKNVGSGRTPSFIQGVEVFVDGTDADFTVTAITNDPGNLTKVWRGRGRQIDLNSFEVIKVGYTEIMNSLWKEIGQMINLTAGEKERFEKAPFNLTHLPGGSVAERRVGRGITELYNKIKAQANTTDARTKEILKELGLEVYLDYL